MIFGFIDAEQAILTVNPGTGSGKSNGMIRCDAGVLFAIGGLRW